MKQFLKKRWHGIPVGIVSGLLALVLVAGGAFAAYGWLNFNIEVEVMEPLTIEYQVYDQQGASSGWLPVSDGDILTISGHAGNWYDLDLRIHSASRSELIVNTIFDGDTDEITCTGFPNWATVAADYETVGMYEWTGNAIIKINNTTEPGTYSVTVEFTRE